MVQFHNVSKSLLEAIVNIIESNYSDLLGSKKLKQDIIDTWANRQRAHRESKKLDREASKHPEDSKEHIDFIGKRDAKRKESVEHHREYSKLQDQHKRLHGNHYDVESHYD